MVKLLTDAENKTIKYFRNTLFNVKSRMVIKYLKAKVSEECSNICIEYMIQLRDHLNYELEKNNPNSPKKIIEVNYTEEGE